MSILTLDYILPKDFSLLKILFKYENNTIFLAYLSLSLSVGFDGDLVFNDVKFSLFLF